MDSLRELERSTQAASLATDADGQPTQNKLSYEARKEQSKAIKKVGESRCEAENKITELENSIAAIEARLATPEGASDMQLYERHQKLKQQLDGIVEEWERVSMELEEAKN